ncbi:hypothetical protein, partial [Rhodoferax sp. UBA5149]|uniref:hypothetical protein n=1 Tax=Rhodoferax sp. UBA5149 TaxID=1947379 RepID=UPI0025D5A762
MHELHGAHYRFDWSSIQYAFGRRLQIDFLLTTWNWPHHIVAFVNVDGLCHDDYRLGRDSGLVWTKFPTVRLKDKNRIFQVTSKCGHMMWILSGALRIWNFANFTV